MLCHNLRDGSFNKARGKKQQIQNDTGHESDFVFQFKSVIPIIRLTEDVNKLVSCYYININVNLYIYALWLECG